MANILDCVIIGSGPAGYTAAVYAARAEMNPEVYTGLEPGGQLTTTTDVDNYPGFPKGITGPDLMMEMQKQAERFETKVHMEYVSKVEFATQKGGIHKIWISKKEIQARTVIIATGATAKYLGLPAENKYRGGGVSACATCDGFFFKGRDVIVVGGGDTAAEEATYLAKIVNKVYMLVRRDQFRASKAMIKRVHNMSNIEVLHNTELIDIEGTGTVVEYGVTKNNVSGEVAKLKVDGVFIAIGHKPNTEIFKGQLDLDKNGYIITKHSSTKTNLPGVFAAGDVQDSTYRQAVTAAGTGCMAALDAENYLLSLQDADQD